jgi:hypothetical protein
MNIPKRFKLFGVTISVELRDTLEAEMAADGYAFPALNKVQLQRPTDTNLISEDAIAITFWHEALHIILDKMSEEELSKNEKFVDLLAHLVHQTLTTMEYEDDVKPVGKKSR